MAIGRYQLTALDCPDALALAAFYSQITGWPVREQFEGLPQWIELVSETGATIAFQQVDNYSPPAWPGQEHPQQLHLDFEVADLEEGERAVLAIGAVKHEFQPMPKAFRVYLDPAGHPFCLVAQDWETQD